MQNHDLTPPDNLLPEAQKPQREGDKRLRIPLRWRWSVLVGLTVALAILTLFFVTLDIEHDAWLENQAAQAELQVDRLTDELKLPLLSGSSTETDLVVHSFLSKVPTVLSVVIRYPDGKIRSLGSATANDDVLKALSNSNTVKRLPVKQFWYAKSVIYAKTDMGIVAVRFSEKQWEDIAGKLVQKIFTAAVVIVLLSGILVYWIAGRMSKPIEMLSDAALKVADGNYQVRLPVQGNDELSDALFQFNVMARELEHKEELRDVFSRYLNPELIKEVFESGDVQVKNHRQEVSVLFADMVRFTSFSESIETEDVIKLLNDHFEIFHRVIAYYGGHVDKYIGDAVMAVFNHPIANRDHARHAAEAGLAISIACRKLARSRPDGEPVSFRVGLNCGQAIVGNIGAARRLEYTVIGDAVNMASRMSTLGKGGELVMPRKTFDFLGEGFDFQPIGVQNIKGVSREVEIGLVVATDPAVLQNIHDVVDLAFNLELPENARQTSGDS